jgi:predicted membrane-bound spermidine synthase
VVLAVLAGFVGMVLETTLILHYQVKSGVLYQNLGALLMAFMAGLAVGSGLVSAFVRSAAATRLPAKRTWGVGLFGGFSVANLAFIGFLKLDLAIGLAAVSLLLLVGGFLVSGVFAYATLLGEEDQRTLVSPLYAADLVGGCAGSVLASIVLIPFLGMEQTAGVMAVLSLAALLAV